MLHYLKLDWLYVPICSRKTQFMPERPNVCLLSQDTIQYYLVLFWEVFSIDINLYGHHTVFWGEGHHTFNSEIVWIQYNCPNCTNTLEM